MSPYCIFLQDPCKRQTAKDKQIAEALQKDKEKVKNLHFSYSFATI